MSFDKSLCSTKPIYCGSKSSFSTTKYSRKGSPYECLQKGFGSGLWSEKVKHLPKSSLQHIPYLNIHIEKRFASFDIHTLSQLKSFMRKLSKLDKQTFLFDMCTHSGKLDFKAYNSIILFLYDNSIQSLPDCHSIPF
jgi:hypothetical protein